MFWYCLLFWILRCIVCIVTRLGLQSLDLEFLEFSGILGFQVFPFRCVFGFGFGCYGFGFHVLVWFLRFLGFPEF